MNRTIACLAAMGLMVAVFSLPLAGAAVSNGWSFHSPNLSSCAQPIVVAQTVTDMNTAAGIKSTMTKNSALGAKATLKHIKRSVKRIKKRRKKIKNMQ